MNLNRIACLFRSSVVSIVLGGMIAGVATAEIRVDTQSWSSDTAGFSEFNSQLMSRDDANLLKFPGSKLVESDGINAAHTSMLTDGTAGVWVGTGRIYAADGRPSRVVLTWAGHA